MMPDTGYRLDPAIAERLAASPCRIVITGAGGWLGLATIEMLRHALQSQFAQRVFCYGSAARTLTLRDGTVQQHALEALGELAPAATLVLHGAFLTKDRAEAMDAGAFQAANRALRQRVLDALEGIGAQALFVPSSGAAREAENPGVSEAMRLYGALKREDEDDFATWAQAQGRTAVIARLFNLSGPYINKHANYALASFIADALAGRPIQVRATHPVVRSYVAIRELMSIVFALLLADRPGLHRFDTAGTDSVEIRDMACLVAELVGTGMVEAAAIDSAARPDVYVGDPIGYKALSLATGIRPIDFRTQIAETAAYMATVAQR